MNYRQGHVTRYLVFGWSNEDGLGEADCFYGGSNEIVVDHALNNEEEPVKLKDSLLRGKVYVMTVVRSVWQGNKRIVAYLPADKIFEHLA